MKPFAIFLILGLSFAVPGEVLNQILARHSFQAFRSTMVSYAVLLVVGFVVERGITRVVGKFKAQLTFYLLFGSLGLMVEWFLLGNAPVLEPFQIITQPGMFTYWGTMLLAPWLIQDWDFAPWKKSFIRFFASFSLLYLLVALVVPKEKGGIFFGFIIFASGTTALNWFYVKYFNELAKG